MLPQTPSQTVGPFFHYGLFMGDDNILVTGQTAGERILITGTVFDGEGQPIPDAMVEIWQADTRGYFNHPADPNHTQADRHFRSFGRADTKHAGRYWFKTIRPGGIVGTDGARQAPHISVRIFARGMLIHVYTRLYFPNEEANTADLLLHSIDSTRRSTLIAVLEEGNDLPTYRFDIHIQGERETVFFEP